MQIFDCVYAGRLAVLRLVTMSFFDRASGLYTSNHALDAWERSQGDCYSKPIKIGDNVWLGAGLHVNQGVTIGDNSVIGSGSVVTKDTSANVVVVGVLCRVIRPITDQDKSNYQP